MASATTGRATLADISDNFKCVPETPPKTNFLNGMGEIEVADLSNDVELESSKTLRTLPSPPPLQPAPPADPTPATPQPALPHHASAPQSLSASTLQRISAQTPRSSLKRSATDNAAMSQPPSKSQRVELPVFEYSDSDDDSGSDTDFNNIQYYEPEVDPIALTMLETLDRRRRARDNVGDDLIVHLVDEIPLEADAPVGYRSQKRNRLRRLHKKGDLEDDDLSDDDDEVNIDKAFDDGGDLEEEIERDRAKIEEAARSMGLRPKSVIIHRSEEIITVDPMGEAAVEGELVLSLSSQQKAKAKAPLPGVDAEDEMEYISGDQLGAKDVERQFEDVTETRLMWRVPNMKTPLLEHQVLGVDWMLKHEFNTDGPKGGLVADAMGLGKTIQSIATMCLNPPIPPPTDRAYLKKDYPQVTLIVAPAALLDQWKDEIITHCKKNEFSVFIHHGQNRVKTAKELWKMDVVICTYHAIMNSFPSIPKDLKRKMTKKGEQENWLEDHKHLQGPFHKVKFWRVILDECHIIKNKLGRISLACGELDSVNTWALSGTPFQNKLEDIFPILRFMGHPCGYMAEFKELTKGKDERMNANRVQAVLRTCMMRRTKKETLMGKPLIVLPKKRIRMVTLKLNEEEFALYRAVEQHAIDKINKYVQKGTEMKHFSHVLTMLLRCRQVCDHPFLVLQHINKDFSADDLDNALAKVKETDTNSVDQKVALSASRVSKLRKVLQAARKQKPTGDVHHCPICTGEVEDPIITKKCRHTFCRECITNSMTENPCCPFVTANGVCGQELDERDLKMDSDTGVAEDAETGDWMENADLEWMPSTKTEAFRKQLGEWRINHPNDKIVLFSQFTKMLDIIQRVLDDDLWSYTRYQGGMTMEERAEALNTFKSDPGCQIMLISIKAGGVGLNLTHANLVICIDLWWNAAVELQAFDRVHRLGQKKEVFITRFCTQDTVESRMLSLQKKKLAMSKAAMGEGDAALGKLTRQDLLGLFGEITIKNGRRVLQPYGMGVAPGNPEQD